MGKIRFYKFCDPGIIFCSFSLLSYEKTKNSWFGFLNMFNQFDKTFWSKESQIMAQLNTVYHALIELVLRHDFDALSKNEEKSRRVFKISFWSQTIALITDFCLSERSDE